MLPAKRRYSQISQEPSRNMASHGPWVYEGNKVLNEYLGVELRKYKHAEYNTGVVLGNVDGPICSAVMVFATQEKGEKGLTHCLEHMCFMESKSFPRGVLDLVAVRSGSNGTNASTDSDNTQYEFDVAGEAGLHAVLPVFISHILSPSLTQHAFLTEVFHVNGKGERQGTVYSEMVGRANSESDKLWIESLNLLFGKHTPYGNNCGGEPDEIARLTVNELKKYHQEVYTTDNLDVIITGKFKDADVLDSLHKALTHSVTSEGAKTRCTARPFTNRFAPPAPDAYTCTSFDEAVKKGGRFSNGRAVVHFPSDDESVGSVMYTQRLLDGDLKDNFATTATDVAFRYLADLSSSPLNQEFVEIENPLASAVSADSMSAMEAYFVIEFSGVPFKAEEDEGEDAGAPAGAEGEGEPAEGAEGAEEGEGAGSAEEDEEDCEEIEDEVTIEEGVSDMLGERDFLLNRFAGVVQGVVDELRAGDGGAAWEGLQKALLKERISAKESFEDGPHHCVSGAMVPELVFKNYEHASGPGIPFGSLMDQEGDFGVLAAKDKEWWADFIDRLLLQGLRRTLAGETGGVTEVRAIPSEKLSQANDAKALRITKENKKRFGAGNLKKLQAVVDEAELLNKINLSDEVRAKFPDCIKIGDVADITRTVEHHRAADRTVEAVEVAVQTGFVPCVAAFGVQHVPAELRRYLYLFTELLMESDVAGMPYEKVVQEMDKDLVTYFCGVGRFSKFMSVGIQPNVVSLYLVAEPEKAANIAKWAQRLMHEVTFTKQRVATQCKNLLSDISENVRDAGSLSDHAMSFAMFDPHSQHCLLNPFAQKNFLKACLKDPEGTIAKLNELRAVLASDPATEVSYLVAGRDAAVRKSVLDGVSGAITRERTGAAPVPRLYTNSQWGDGSAERRTKQGRSFAIGVGGVDAAAVSVNAPVNVDSRKEFWALRLLCECISLAEGDLQLAIRGKGLAYGAGVYYSTYQSTVSLEMWECTNVKEALPAALNVLRSIGEDHDDAAACSVLTEFNIKNAIGSMVYSLKSKRATPSDVIDSTHTSCFRQLFSPEADSADEAVLQTVELEDLRAAYNKHVAKLLNDPALVAGVITSPKLVVEASKVWQCRPSLR